jgi:hypothetical protein
MPIIGYWNTGLNDDQFIAPQEVAEKLAPEMIEKVVGYLRQGAFYTQYRGLSLCRFVDTCSEQYMGSSEFTDGYWIWPEGLIHYVEMHRILLPKEFLADVLKPTTRKNITPDPDLGFWIKWCKQNRDQAVIQKLITDQYTKYGISDQICLCAGCNEKALQNSVFCPNHLP